MMNKLTALMKESAVMLQIAVLVLVMGFAYVEPGVLQSAEDQFEIKQTVTAEITFSTAASDITMQPSIAGITGGTGNGGTQFVVRTNNNTGYQLTITASSSVGMLGEQHGDSILKLSPATPGVPDYSFDTAPANSSAFAYTISASTTGDLVQAFKDNGSACNTGAGDTLLKCWLDATTTAYTLINRSTATSHSGSTSTINFRAIISANPIPEIDEDVYTATSTLTATIN